MPPVNYMSTGVMDGDHRDFQPDRSPARRQLRRRRLLIGGFLIIGLLAAAAYVLDLLARTDGGAMELPVTGPTVAPTRPAPAPRPSDPPQPRATEPVPVLSMPGEFPSQGPGEFRYASGVGQVIGERGGLRRFRLAVERGVDEDLSELAGFVDATLASGAGWTAGGDFRFQRVPGDAGHDFTILLATAGTTERLCGAGGLRVVAPALPDGGVSCRVAGQVIINLHRWRMSVPHYVDEQVPLHIYRQMLLNHEIGHELGYGHEGCPGDGEFAPVMQQQTITLDGCRAYPWPYRDGERHTGPPVP